MSTDIAAEDPPLPMVEIAIVSAEAGEEGWAIALSPLLAEAQAERERLIEASFSKATISAYEGDWRAWCAFASAARVPLFPAAPDHVAAYATFLYQREKQTTGGGRHTYATIERRIVGLSHLHGKASPPLPPPGRADIVRATLRGIRRTIGQKPTKKRAITATQLEMMLRSFPDTPQGRRDKAILCVGFCGGFRRSELTELDFGDVSFTEAGVHVTVRKGKTDQAGRGLTKGIPRLRDASLCPVRLLQAWIAERGDLSGPLFYTNGARGRGAEGRMLPRRMRSAMVAEIVKRAARAAHVDPALVAGHSLRSGFISYAIRSGAAEAAIMRITGHKDHQVMSEYFQQENAIGENPVRGMF